MRKYVIMGIQGSGKGTHAKMLAGGFDLEHIAVGDIFRWNVQHHTKLGAQVRRTMAAGLLVGDDLVEGVVKQRLSEHDWNYGFIIDGFPRNQRQAEFFLESYDIDGVIHLDLPDSEVARRVLARRLCAGCGMDYSLIDNSPSTDGQVRRLRRRADQARRRHRGGARRPAPRVSREDQSRAGHLRPQGVRHHGGLPARPAAGPAGHQGQDRAAAFPRDGGEQPG